MPHRRLSAIGEAVSLVETEIGHGDIPPDLERRIIALGIRIRLNVREALSARKSPRILADRLMSTLRIRFDSEDWQFRSGIDWREFGKSVRFNSEALSELLRLERAGLEPHLAGVEGDEYVIRYSASGKDKDSGRIPQLRVKKYEE
jgi:hypothetical protein